MIPPSIFHPYFIFVAWTSTTRPTTNLAKAAMLPFGLDSAAEPLTNLIDKVPLHLLSAWKQSLNATQNVFSSQYPNDYLGTDWKEKSYGYFIPNLMQDADEIMGEDVPVPELLFRIMQQKQVPAVAARDRAKPDPLNPVDDVCVSLAKTKLHLGGHSYGAKLVTAAGMEAIRRWILETIAVNENPKKPPFAPDIGPYTFSRFIAQPFVTDMPMDFADSESLWQREKFYSFDARQIYDTRFSMVGSHSDLSKPELVNEEACQDDSSDCEGFAKRDATFNFVFNFTKTNFEHKFCELNPEEIQEFGVDCAAEKRESTSRFSRNRLSENGRTLSR